MEPAYAIYLIESHWSWDHNNTEIATTTIEGREGFRYELELERLANPDLPLDERKKLMKELAEITRAQDKSPDCNRSYPVRLYRVIDYDGVIRYYDPKQPPKVELKLQLICEFDRDGNLKKPEASQDANPLDDVPTDGGYGGIIQGWREGGKV